MLRSIGFTGDAELAAALQYLARHLRWEVEEDLSRVVGDVAAHRIASTARDFLAWQKDAGVRLGENVAEYLTEEAALVAPPAALARFGRDVADLVDALERLEKRLDRIDAKLRKHLTAPAPPSATETREAVALLVLTGIALVVSGIGPVDRGTWVLEVAPVLIAAPLLYFTWRPFRLTPLTYRLIFLHALILMLGGHYTYAHVPLGFWLQDLFDFARNPYDRIGHFAQGSSRRSSRARSCSAARRSRPASGRSSSCAASASRSARCTSSSSGGRR